MVAPLKVGLAGLGTVGASVIRLIVDGADQLTARCARPIEVVAVTARKKGKDRGVDLSGYLRDWLAVAPKTKGNLKLEVDVDPQSFL